MSGLEKIPVFVLLKNQRVPQMDFFFNYLIKSFNCTFPYMYAQ